LHCDAAWALIMIVVSGNLSDQPWGQLLAGLAEQRVTGELVVTASDGKRYTIAFARGAIATASSPLVADSVARIALLAQLVSSSQVAAIAKAVGDTARDEVDALADLAHLSPAQSHQLRTRMVIQRAARTFSIEHGTYAFAERAVAPGCEVDVAAAIYLGARMHLSQQRLTDELRELGTRFELRVDGFAVDRYGFTEEEQPILEALRGGTTLPELEAQNRDIDPRTAQAVIYTLVVTGACTATGGIARGRVATEDVPRARTVTFEAPTRVRFAKQTASDGGVALPRTITPRSATANARQTIDAAKARIKAGGGHYTVLGLTPDASLDAIRSAYVSFAFQLHPDKRPALGGDEQREANDVFGRISQAYAVLSDPLRRAEYHAELERKGGTPVEPPDRRQLAGDAFDRGMAALHREDMDAAVTLLARAVELAPSDVDYAAAHAWARFCAAPVRDKVANETRRALERAIYRSAQPVRARFYLGLVERMLGRTREAMYHFREVLLLDPEHAEAAAEIRILEARSERRR
jgi:hypothetical protein